MTGWRTAILGTLCGAAAMSPVSGKDLSSYRGFQFGMNLNAAAKLAGTAAGDATVVHQRPALLQEMEWQPRPFASTDSKAEAVKQGLLEFYNGELFRIVITYDRYRIEGMTAEDMIEGISAMYGTASRPTVEIAYHSNYGELAPVIARWENEEYSYNLVRTGDRSSFAMVLFSKRMDVLAQSASLEAIRLDAQEAPRREVEKQKKVEEDEHAVLEKARSLNKPNFRP